MSQGISYGGIENKKQASANTSIASNYSHFHAPARTNQISDGTAVNNTGEKDHSQTATDTVTDTGTDGYLYEYAVQLVSIIPEVRQAATSILLCSRPVASFMRSGQCIAIGLIDELKCGLQCLGLNFRLSRSIWGSGKTVIGFGSCCVEISLPRRIRVDLRTFHLQCTC